MNGCLNIRTKRIGAGMPLSTLRQSDAIDIYTKRRGGFSSINVGLVCSLEHLAKLSVSKDEMWLTKLNNYEDSVIVWSNVTWNIE